MGKKDFNDSTENVFDDFFTHPTTIKKKEELSETDTTLKTSQKESIKRNSKTNSKKETSQKLIQQIKTTEFTEEQIIKKSSNKKCRFNFYLDPELADFINNYLWLTKNRSYSQYFNDLIKQDLLNRLGLPTNTSSEELSLKWEIFKKENNL